jgi:hypothetical protein
MPNKSLQLARQHIGRLSVFLRYRLYCVCAPLVLGAGK